MTKIILLTALTRVKNLPTMLDSIKRSFGATEKERLENGFDLLWVIVKDKYNCDGDISVFYEQLFNEGIGFYGFECGKEGQKNYGGNMYNEPLEWLFKHYCVNGTDPWIYIFDDDNIIHPLLPYFLKNAEEKFPSKKAIWLHYEGQDGQKRITYKFTAFLYVPYCDGSNFLINNPDPSCIIVKSSVYKEIFPLDGRVDYDYTSIRDMMQKLFSEDEIIFQDDIEYWKNRMGAFHNGISEKSFIEGTLLPEDFNISCVLQDGRWDQNNLGSKRFVLPKEANKEIIEILEKYNYAMA